MAKLINAYHSIGYMPRSYHKPFRENSKISIALEGLAKDGIDCIKIRGGIHNLDGGIYLPINVHENKDAIKEIFSDGGWFDTEDMYVESDLMKGCDIKSVNPKLKYLKDKELYTVFEFHYRR